MSKLSILNDKLGFSNKRAQDGKPCTPVHLTSHNRSHALRTISTRSWSHALHTTYIRQVQTFEDFLKMCKQANITLNPAKVRVGYEREQFFGLTVDNGKIEPAERNIDPVVNMTYPKNRSELRSAMGVFNQFKHFLHNYARGESPAVILNNLTSPKADWEFTERHRKAIESSKRPSKGAYTCTPPTTNTPSS